MTIREKMRFIMDNEDPETLEQAKELAKHQWDIIKLLMDQKEETFAMYRQLEDNYLKLSEFLKKQMIDEHVPDKLVN